MENVIIDFRLKRTVYAHLELISILKICLESAIGIAYIKILVYYPVVPVWYLLDILEQNAAIKFMRFYVADESIRPILQKPYSH